MRQILYKIVPKERVSYLEDQLIRFTQPGDLNDPLECLAFYPPNWKLKGKLEEIDTVSALYETISPRPADLEQRLLNFEKLKDSFKKGSARNALKDFLEEMEIVLANFNSLYAILSLTQRWNSSLMWSHYSDRHRGFCLGFASSHDFFKQPDDSVSPLTPVTYGHARIGWVELEHNPFGSARLLAYKSAEWAYEEEWRLIYQHDERKCDKLGVKKINGYDCLLYKVPHEVLAELIVGCQASSELEEQVLRKGSDLGLPVWKVYPSLIDLTFERMPLNDAARAQKT